MLSFLQPSGVFFDMFEQMARQVEDSAEHLRTFLRGFPGNGEALAQIRDDEHRADEVAHQLLARLDRNYQTPIDGDDIHALATDLDNIVDDIDALAKRFLLFHVTAVEPTFFKQADVLVDAGRNVNESVRCLRERRHWPEMMPRLIELNRLESVGDGNHYAALSGLFDGSNDALFVIKWKALYDLIEESIDECEDVAKTLQRIVLKNA